MKFSFSNHDRLCLHVSQFFRVETTRAGLARRVVARGYMVTHSMLWIFDGEGGSLDVWILIQEFVEWVVLFVDEMDGRVLNAVGVGGGERAEVL